MPVSNRGAEMRNYVVLLVLTTLVVASVFAVGRALHEDTIANRKAIQDVRAKQNVIQQSVDYDRERARANRLLLVRILKQVDKLSPEELEVLEERPVTTPPPEKGK